MSARSAKATTIEAELAAILGPDCLIGPEDRARYEHGARYGTGRAAAIVRPRDVAGVQWVMRFARAQGRRLLAQGAHTGLVGAATPDMSGRDIVISLERLRSVEIAPLDRLAVCGAGARLSALNAAAATHGLSLPIDLGADPSLGGMVATNTGGARLIRYGDVRRHLIGVEAVLPDGTLFRDIKGLRKNNVGLDVKQLFVGTGGEYGIVTEVQIELRSLPRQSATMLAVPRDMAAVPHIVAALESALGDLLSACEGMSRYAIQAALAAQPSLHRPFRELPAYALLVEAGSPLAPDSGLDVEAILTSAMMALLEGSDPLLQDVIVGRGAEFWALRHAISEGMARRGKVIGLDISVARSRLPELREDLIAMVATRYPFLDVGDFGHIGDGGMHFNIVIPSASTDKERIEDALRAAVYDIVMLKYNGSFSAEHGLGPTNAHFAAIYGKPSCRVVLDAVNQRQSQVGTPQAARGVAGLKPSGSPASATNP